VGLTLLDSLDALLLFGMEDDFRRGLRLIEEHVHFNASARVHVFELTIRCHHEIPIAIIPLADITEFHALC
jgi:hypothetical protein